MHRYLIVVAGGRGLRMGASVPKQFLTLAGKPVIFHAIDRFLDYDPAIELVIVLPEDSKGLWEELCIQYDFKSAHNIVTGGEERYNSVRNGLSLIRQKSLVAVHDAVRPFVSTETIDKCFTVAAEKGNAVPFIKPPGSVREIFRNNRNRPLKREKIALIQTPQVFRSDILLAAYARAYRPDFTDDATVVEAAGHNINLVPGNPENIKITTKLDMILAETILTINYEL
ncbi:MAG: 2-C-methyl-D-erythritol 4-phosphate cytidylyltransferase [Bacteroidales bacterium]|nr:2-C-methyl-D-erythritol 4-phosphate cytidylyltransferase [Bacteroidales bacterium]